MHDFNLGQYEIQAGHLEGESVGIVSCFEHCIVCDRPNKTESGRQLPQCQQVRATNRLFQTGRGYCIAYFRYILKLRGQPQRFHPASL